MNKLLDLYYIVEVLVHHIYWKFYRLRELFPHRPMKAKAKMQGIFSSKKRIFQLNFISFNDKVKEA
jgi:hypothetical protein